jgi:uncharacterized repeat protein (TIGR03847 family)
MPRQVYQFRDPDRFVVGTVGMPGERTFFLQARQGSAITSVVIEKSQASVLADRIDQLLDGARGCMRPVAARPWRSRQRAPDQVADTQPLDVPIAEEFRVGAMALGCGMTPPRGWWSKPMPSREEGRRSRDRR